MFWRGSVYRYLLKRNIDSNPTTKLFDKSDDVDRIFLKNLSIHFFVLELFNFKCEKVLIIRSCKMWFSESSKMSEVSSAYWKILCSLLLIIIPMISMFCFMRIARIFAHIENKYGLLGPDVYILFWLWTVLTGRHIVKQTP